MRKWQSYPTVLAPKSVLAGAIEKGVAGRHRPSSQRTTMWFLDDHVDDVVRSRRSAFMMMWLTNRSISARRAVRSGTRRTRRTGEPGGACRPRGCTASAMIGGCGLG